MLHMGLLSSFYLGVTNKSMTCLCGYTDMGETATQDESDQWPMEVFSHSIWIKLFNVMWHLSICFSGGLGSASLTVGLDDLN